jgi:hypothetical protein
MKNRKRAGRIAAAVVASLALAFSVAAPASASGYWLTKSGSVNCPSFMVARISFKSTGYGYVTVGPNPYSSVGQSFTQLGKINVTQYAYSGASGYAKYQFWMPSGYIYDFYATCVV